MWPDGNVRGNKLYHFLFEQIIVVKCFSTGFHTFCVVLDPPVDEICRLLGVVVVKGMAITKEIVPNGIQEICVNVETFLWKNCIGDGYEAGVGLRCQDLMQLP